MSTYNRRGFLSCSIEGILSQTFKDFEFIIVNNGSVDDSLQICSKYAEEDKRIKLINIPENHGAPRGRNKGLSAATGEFITFVDDDDHCEPKMLEILWNLSQTYNSDISLCGSWNNIDGRLEPYFIFDETLILDKVQGLDELLLRKRYNVAPPTKLFRKTLFEGISFKEKVLVDDIHIIYKVFANANRVVANGEPLYSFRKHANNMTHFIQTNKPSPEVISEYLSAFRERTKYLSEKVKDITPRVRYSEWSYMLSMCEKIMDVTESGYMELYKSMLGSIQKNYCELINGPFITEREKRLLKVMLNS